MRLVNRTFNELQTGDVAELRGMKLFFGEKAECFHCHSSFNFNDQIVHAGSRIVETPFHNTGLYNLDGRGAYPAISPGLIEQPGLAADMGRFRVPSLRNVAMTAPYFHDGSAPTLERAIDVMFQYQLGRIPSDEDRRLIMLFLKTLTAEKAGQP